MGMGPALREEMQFADGRIQQRLVPRLPRAAIRGCPGTGHPPAEPPRPALGRRRRDADHRHRPAIANAVFHATGVRVREMPIRLPTESGVREMEIRIVLPMTSTRPSSNSSTAAPPSPWDGIEDAGSTPQKAGAKAVIDAAGRYGEPSAAARRSEARDRATARRFGPSAACDGRVRLRVRRPAQATQPICGGSMRVLIDPAVADHRAVYAAAADAHRRRERGVLVTTCPGSSPARGRLVRWFSERTTSRRIPRSPR